MEDNKNQANEHATPVDGADYMGIPTQPSFGVVSGKKQARVVMKIVSGPMAGMEFPYTVKKWDSESMKFDIPRLKAAGWAGRDFATFERDILARAATGVPIQFKARLAEFEGRTWWTASQIGSYTPPVKAPSADDLAEANDWLAQYNASHGGAALQQQTYSSGGSGTDDPPPPVDEDIPFIVSGMPRYRSV